MKQDHILNFLWWLATPFFIVFFFLILMLFTAGGQYINAFLYLTLFLVTIPLFVDWFVAMFYPKKEELRPKISSIVFVIDFTLTYLFFVKDFSQIIQFFYIVFAFQIIISFVLRLFKQNQYTFLLGVFLTITVLFSVILIFDLFFLVLFELLFAGIFIRVFYKNKMDSINQMLLYYFLGIFSTLLFSVVVFFILKI